MPQDDQAEADLDDTSTGADQTGAEHDSEISGATNLDEYRALVDQYSSQPAQAVVDDEPTYDEPEGNGEGTEEESDEQSSEEEDEQEEESPDPEEESDEENEPAAQTRFRLKAKNQVEATALYLRKQNPDWSLEDCLAKAKQALGVTDKKDDAPVDEVDDGTPKTVAEARQKLAQLRADKKAAYEALELDKVGEIDEQIENLRDLMPDLHERERNADVAQQQEFESTVENSKAKAVQFYPDVTDSNSALVKKMAEIDAALKETDNPLFSSPDKPWKLTVMAANELGIAPKASQKPAAKPAPKPATRRPVQPASGAARSTPPASAAAKVDEQIEGIGSMADYENLVSSFSQG